VTTEADLERELKKARYMKRAAHRHALQAEADEILEVR